MFVKSLYHKALFYLPIALGLILIVKALWIPAKAELGQFLLDSAWQKTLITGDDVKPWPWSDYVPTARLVMTKYGIKQVVLSGDEGSAIAFAPGENSVLRHTDNAARVISGHRDTHFKFLKNVQIGDELSLEDQHGIKTYHIVDLKIVDASQTYIEPDNLPQTLFLVTCYPFDSLTAGGKLRYVVIAKQREGKFHAA